MNQANDHLEDKFQQLQKPLYRKKDHYLICVYVCTKTLLVVVAYIRSCQCMWTSMEMYHSTIYKIHIENSNKIIEAV